jgi:hypothetical protein
MATLDIGRLFILLAAFFIKKINFTDNKNNIIFLYFTYPMCILSESRNEK